MGGAENEYKLLVVTKMKMGVQTNVPLEFEQQHQLDHSALYALNYTFCNLTSNKKC